MRVTGKGRVTRQKALIARAPQTNLPPLETTKSPCPSQGQFQGHDQGHQGRGRRPAQGRPILKAATNLKGNL